MTDKKWFLCIGLVMALFFYLFLQFVQQSRQIQHIVNQLKQDKKLENRHIVLIVQELGHPYWQMVANGAIEAAKADNISIEIVGPVRNSVEEQIKLLEKAILSKVDAIIVQGLNDEKFTPIINKAMERGIPTLTIDTDAPNSKRLAYVGTDNMSAGKTLGQLVVQKSGGTGAIGVIIGSESAENQLLRLNGLKTVVSEYKGLRIVDVRASNISMMVAIQQATEMLQKHPDISVMVGTSATDALGILQAMKSLNRNDIAVIGFDNLPETLDAIRIGEIEASVVQQPYWMGATSVHLLRDYFRGQSLPSIQFAEVEILDKTDNNKGMLP
ncbi:sugar-binding protein [Paenibacillus chartarius]|uniref:Sugar-binding protein n=1 Tax=Paenibacillus chartarius TaxID=747481 RepID=A0ABV6DR53_9BACL